MCSNKPQKIYKKKLGGNRSMACKLYMNEYELLKMLKAYLTHVL